jgi:hypothetical protein
MQWLAGVMAVRLPFGIAFKGYHSFLRQALLPQVSRIVIKWGIRCRESVKVWK